MRQEDGNGPWMDHWASAKTEDTGQTASQALPLKDPAGWEVDSATSCSAISAVTDGHRERDHERQPRKHGWSMSRAIALTLFSLEAWSSRRRGPMLKNVPK